MSYSFKSHAETTATIYGHDEVRLIDGTAVVAGGHASGDEPLLGRGLIGEPRKESVETQTGD